MFDTQTLLVILTVVIGALIQGTAGFGLGLFSMGFLVMLMPVQEATVIVAILGIFSTALNLWTVRHAVVWSEAWPIVISCIPATIVGGYLLTSLPTDLLRKGLAVMILIGCSATFLSSQGDKLHRPFPWAYVAGIFGGLFGGALNVGGPPGVIYTLLRGWDKEHSKALLSAYFFASAIVRVPTHFVTGTATRELLLRSLVVLPFALASSYLGTKLFSRLSNEVFRYGAMALLTLMALRIFIT